MFLLQGPEKPIEALAFAPDATALYAVHATVGVHVWNLADRTGAGLVVDGRPVFGEFALHREGRWAFGRCPNPDGYVPSEHDSRTIDLPAGTANQFNFLGVVGQSVALAPDGRALVTYGHSDYDAARKAKVRTYRLYGWTVTTSGPEYAWHLDTPADAGVSRVTFVGTNTLVTEDWIRDGPGVGGYQPTEPRLAVRTAATGKVLRTIEAPTDRIEQLLASPDGRQVVVRGGTQMWVYDATDWVKPPVAVEGKHWNNLDERAAAFHPSAPYLLLANNGPSVLVFDTTTWKQGRKWNWKAGTLRAVAVSPDGTLAAAGGTHGTAVVWDLDL